VDKLGEMVTKYPELPPISEKPSRREKIARYIVGEEKRIIREAAMSVMKLIEFEE